MLATAIEHFSDAKASVKELLEITDRIKESYPKMLKIWKHSQAALEGLHKRLEKWIETGEKLKARVARGEVKLDEGIKVTVS